MVLAGSERSLTTGERAAGNPERCVPNVLSSIP
jgi:hypothetical protein